MSDTTSRGPRDEAGERVPLGPFAAPWKYEPLGQVVHLASDASARVCDIRGWGHLTGGSALALDDATAAAIQDAVGRSIVDAHNRARASLAPSAERDAVVEAARDALNAAEVTMGHMERDEDEAESAYFLPKLIYARKAVNASRIALDALLAATRREGAHDA